MFTSRIRNKVFRRSSSFEFDKIKDDDSSSCVTVDAEDSRRSRESSTCEMADAENITQRSRTLESRPLHIDAVERPFKSILKLSDASPSSRTHSVVFSEDTQVRPIVSMADLVKKKSELWYQKKDYERTIAKSQSLLKKSQKKCKPEICLRGLENLNKDKEERRDAWAAVLEEQSYQRLKDFCDEEAIAQLYIRTCVKSHLEAEVRAIQDAQAAFEC
eukprot:scaffold24050_cov166-Cylindrotheca_fusiformis.AAC.1